MKERLEEYDAMNAFTTRLYAQMNEALNQTAIVAENKLQQAEQSYRVVKDAIRSLKEYVLAHPFVDQSEEINFFKEVKPLFVRELIYFVEIFYIESGKPVGCKEAQMAYFTHVMEPIRVFFERNQFLYTYYRMGKTNYDKSFFLHNSSPDLLLPEYFQDVDPRFSTLHSFKLAKILAFEQLQDYIQQSLWKLEHIELMDQAGEKKEFRSRWTDSKAALIELAYALHSRGSVNQGKSDVKQLISDLEILFNVRVGNFYRTFQSMRIRKNRTSYLDDLKESLERRMDDTDLGLS